MNVNKTDFTNRISLISETLTPDEYGNQESAETVNTVFCGEFSVGASEFYRAAENNLRIKFAVMVNTEEYADEEKAEYKSERFAVYRVYKRADGYTELYLKAGR